MNDREQWLRALWAKSGTKEGEKHFHPLICHLLDVAAVTAALWDGALSPAARRQIAAELGFGEDQTAARWWIVFLAGMHDIGKASPAFQYLPPRGKTAPPIVEGTAIGVALAAAGLTRGVSPNAPHGKISTVILRDLLPSHYGWDAAVAQTIAVAIGGHHGVFPASDVFDASKETMRARGHGVWREMQAALAAALADLLGDPPSLVPTTAPTATAMDIAGLVSVADWIGSDDTIFTYARNDDLATYRNAVYAKATCAITDLLWRVPATESTRPFTAIFPRIAEPNAMQQAVIERARHIAQPGLTIIEAPMGEGKTEAALYLAEQSAIPPLDVAGFYIALPTQATSNGMFGRVRAYLEGRFPADGEGVNLQLLHGQADLAAEFALLRKRADTPISPVDVNRDDEDTTRAATAGVVAAEWFTYRKRGLLAPFGVGTVDQALLAVLQTRHVFVRLFGLAHKTVIVDEVHAYDTYMTTLLRRLLAWLGALGCPVILLSATLPNKRRQDLLAAYEEGRGAPLPRAAAATAQYPRLSWVENGTIKEKYTPASARATKRATLSWLDGTIPEGDTTFPLGELLRATLAGGGCAAVICNTVARAQAVYRALAPYFADADGCPAIADDGEPVLDLFHARYRFKERQAREQRALRRFGPPGGAVEVVRDDGSPAREPVRRPHTAVLVATQVIEQSLDLDFDLMVTDLAPADLVLQRAGRLRRHERGSRPTGDDCVLHVCAPIALSPDDVPTFAEHFTLIYDAHVLLRSWLALRKRRFLTIPEDVSTLIEEVYDDRPCPPEYSDAVQALWNETRANKQQEDAADAEQASDRYVKPPTYRGALSNVVPALALEEDAPELHTRFQALTRLVEESESVVLLYPGECAKIPDGRLPKLSEARELLRHALTVQSRRAVVAIREEGERPRSWEKSRFLRHHRRVRLTEDGAYGQGKYRLRYDREIGLTVWTEGEVMP